MSEFKTLAELQEAAFQLHGRIRATEYTPQKLELMKERDALNFRITLLTKKKIAEAEKDYRKKLETFIKDNLTMTSFAVNKHRIPINPKTLEVEFKFPQCKHTHKMKIYDILKGNNDDRKEEWRLLFQRWQLMFRDNEHYTGGMSCQKCRRDKIRSNTLRGQNKPNGKVDWSLHKLQ